MLRGKIVKDYTTFTVNVGPVTVDITHDLRALLKAEQERADQVIAEIRAELDDVVKRYNRIVSITREGGAGMPSG